MDKLDKVTASARSADLDEKQGVISGSCEASKGDKCVLFVPYSKTFNVEINGEKVDYEKAFYRSLARINNLHMYDRFLETGWTTQLAMDTHQVLIPEIIRAVALNWASCINEAMEIKNAQK